MNTGMTARKQSGKATEQALQLGEAGAFQQAAPAVLAAGLCPIPCGGDDGKRPLVRGWQGLRKPYGKNAVQKFQRQFPAANIGITCTPSRLVVVDIDQPGYFDEILSRFGDTPIIVGTPSGGFHLYYRAKGRCHLPASCMPAMVSVVGDIKAHRAFVVAPNSVRPDGRSYRFVKGSWSEISELPVFRDADQPRSTGVEVTALRRVTEGSRNDATFRYAMQQAPHCDTEEQLIDCVLTWVERQCDRDGHPFSDAEAVRTAKSAWGYQQRDQNWLGTSGVTNIANTDLDLLLSEKGGR